jgi:hypothetical protein
MIGAWRSLVAHLHGVQGVGGSNPLAPISLYPIGLFSHRDWSSWCKTREGWKNLRVASSHDLVDNTHGDTLDMRSGRGAAW